MKHLNIGAIVILYNPNNNILYSIVSVLKQQVGVIYLIDNTPNFFNNEVSTFSKTLSNVQYFPLNKNVGIAEAQNIGIKKVLEDTSMDFVLLLDQDSIPDNNMVHELNNAYEQLISRECSVASIGPLPINRENGDAYKPKVFKGKVVLDGVIQRKEIISSGSLIHRKAIAAIGLMESRLFIDGVDFEWCWRGLSMGFNSYICEKALLEHKLGEGDKKIIGFTVAIPAPIRCFYQYRNFLTLIRRRYVPFRWKLINFFKYFIKMFYYPIFLKNGLDYMNNIFRGIKAGIGKV